MRMGVCARRAQGKAAVRPPGGIRESLRGGGLSDESQGKVRVTPK